MQGKTLLLNIKKRTASQWMLLWITLLPLLWGTLFDLANLSGIVKYTADVAWLALFLFMIFRPNIRLQRNILPLFVLILVFFIYTVILCAFHYQSFLYFLWGVRNNFRYYVVFFAIVFFFDQYDVNIFLRIFDIAFWVNAVVVAVQFVLGYNQDLLGGIFGCIAGCNAYMIIFLCIVNVYSLLRYMSKCESSIACFSKCAISLMIAALAELKAFFLFFVLIVILSSFLTSFSLRKVCLFLVAALLLFVGAALLKEVFNSNFAFSLESLWELATRNSYSDAESVNRLSAIPTLSKLILTKPVDRVFGLGLGNCDTSSFDFLNTPFFQQYSYLRYTWFSCARLFLEVGYVGLGFYLSFFVLCIGLLFRRLKKEGGIPLLCKMGIIICVLSVTMMFYNSSLHTEAGYMFYIALALPFVRVNSASEPSLSQ